MIKTKNTGEFIQKLVKVGAIAAANDVDSITAPFDGYISAIDAVLGLMGTDGTGSPTQDIQVDVKVNGTSVFTGAATSIVWAHAGQVGTANTPSFPTTTGTLTTNPVKVSRGDNVRLDVLQVLNGTSPTQPQNLCVWIAFYRPLQSPPQSTLLGSLVQL